MDPKLFLRGMAIGFAIAAPIGPVGILCIRRALADGRLAAFVAGMGAALADTFYGAVAGFGLTFIARFLNGHAAFLKLGGGVFLVALGLLTWRKATAGPLVSSDGPGPGLVRDFASTFVITLTNPGTIFAFMGVFAAMGAAGAPRGLAESGVIVAGVFAGSALWWLTLSGLASAVRSKFTPEALRRINHLSGAALMVFGLAVLGSLALD